MTLNPTVPLEPVVERTLAGDPSKSSCSPAWPTVDRLPCHTAYPQEKRKQRKSAYVMEQALARSQKPWQSLASQDYSFQSYRRGK